MTVEATHLALFGCVMFTPASAQAVKEELALNNFVHEHAVCAAYYGIASQCTANRGDAHQRPWLIN